MDRRRRVHDARAGAASLRPRAVATARSATTAATSRALRSVTDGSRNAGAIYGFDTFAITPRLTLTYGSRYARYDYLEDRSLLSPRVSLTVAACRTLPHQHACCRSRALAPGAEEFMPRIDSGIWLPPQRTFSSLDAASRSTRNATNHIEVEIERDLGVGHGVDARVPASTSSDQLVTLFGVDMPGASVGARPLLRRATPATWMRPGLSAGRPRTVIASRVHGSVEYSLTRAEWNASPDSSPTWCCFAPSAVAHRPDRHSRRVDVDRDRRSRNVDARASCSIASATRSRPSSAVRTARGTPAARARASTCRSAQSLPFMDFSTAKWEMLVGGPQLLPRSGARSVDLRRAARRPAARSASSAA